MADDIVEIETPVRRRLPPEERERQILEGAIRYFAEVGFDGQTEWTRELMDRSIPLEERLVRYYEDYAVTIFDYEWMRIFMFSGLKGEPINTRYLKLVRERILRVICIELRHSFGLADPAQRPVSPDEIDLAWSLHAAIFYIGVRKWIYYLPAPDDLSAFIRRNVKTFFGGAGPVMKEMVEG